jgi:hypothetical protein
MSISAAATFSEIPPGKLTTILVEALDRWCCTSTCSAALTPG